MANLHQLRAYEVKHTVYNDMKMMSCLRHTPFDKNTNISGGFIFAVVALFSSPILFYEVDMIQAQDTWFYHLAMDNLKRNLHLYFII